MTLMRLKSAPIVLIEDDENNNIVPLVQEITPQEKCTVHMFCYEQPISLWRNVFKGLRNIVYHEEFNSDLLETYNSEKSAIVIDSVNQMSLCLGWSHCLRVLKKLTTSSNVNKLILILHKDCLSHSSKIRINLNHIASAIVSYNKSDSSKIKVLLKKSGKVIRSNETLSYDTSTCTLRSTIIVKEQKTENEPEKPAPESLSTFKIEVDQSDKLEKYKLKLPYMSKINEGESKIFYEPDAVDDWDEEDPDEDLDI